MKKIAALLVVFLVVLSAGCIKTTGISAAKVAQASKNVHSADYSLNLTMISSISTPEGNKSINESASVSGAFDRTAHMMNGTASTVIYAGKTRRSSNVTFFVNGSTGYILLNGTWFKFAIKNRSSGLLNVSALFTFISNVSKNGTIKESSSGYVLKVPLSKSSIEEMIRLHLLKITHTGLNVTNIVVHGGFLNAKLKKDGTPYWIHEFVNMSLIAKATVNSTVRMNLALNLTLAFTNINAVKINPPKGIENAVPTSQSVTKNFHSSLPPLNRKLLIGTESLTKYYVSMDQELPMSLLTSSVHVNALVDESRGVALENISINTLTTNISVYINGSKLQVLSGNAVIGDIVSGNVTIKGMPASASFFMEYATMAKRLLETALEHSNLTISPAGDHYVVRGNVSAFDVMRAINFKMTGTSVRAVLVANFTKEYRPISYAIEIKSPLEPVLIINAKFKELPADFKIVPPKRG
ncbi:MAG: hypothetical protein GXO14_04395 [Thermococci archaeon]|nr:hypothetical protein [Thermococci archaeon]